jgi:hypothetical protein
LNSSAPKSVFRISLKEMVHKVCSFPTPVFRNFRPFDLRLKLTDRLSNLFSVLTFIGSPIEHKLVHYYPKREKIRCKWIILLEKNLRSHIARRPRCLIKIKRFVSNFNLSNSEVSKSCIAALLENDIFWF